MSGPSLLDLPVEIILEIVHHLNGPSLSALLQTAKSIPQILNRNSIAHLRQVYREALLAEESQRRTALGIALDPRLGKEAWWEYGSRSTASPWWISDHAKAADILQLPCYICLAWQPRNAFSTAMGCGPLALGQPRASERLCIGCGAASGFYPGGAGAMKVRVCEECDGLLSPLDGATLLPPRYVRGKHFDRWDDSAKGTDRFAWWWDQSHRCLRCVGTENLDGLDEVQTWWHHKKVQKYALAMVNSKKARVERGRQRRKEQGIVSMREVEQSVDEAPAELANKFPKYKAMLTIYR